MNDAERFVAMILEPGLREIERETLCLSRPVGASGHEALAYGRGMGWELQQAVIASATHWACSSLATLPWIESEDGVYRRVLARLARARFFVADDVGVKAQAVSGHRPTARIETRPGNEQHVWKIEGGCTALEWRLLAQAWGAAGLTDEDGQNPLRLARLPLSQPPGKERARLVDMTGIERPWLALMEFAGVDEPEAHRRLGEATAAGMDGVSGLWGTATEIAAHDRVFKMLLDRRMIQRLSGVGPYWRIICPWCAEHSDGEPTGTRYKPTDHGIGHFICDRGGHHRKQADFDAWVLDQVGARLESRLLPPGVQPIGADVGESTISARWTPPALNL